jgi:hypothetical protein
MRLTSQGIPLRPSQELDVVQLQHDFVKSKGFRQPEEPAKHCEVDWPLLVPLFRFSELFWCQKRACFRPPHDCGLLAVQSSTDERTQLGL